MVERICGVCSLPIKESEVGIRHFGFYTAHSEHRCIELLQAEITRLKEALEVANQLVLEINHAYMNGPDWYTRGESGLRQQVAMWIDKASKSITDALNSNK